jgi:hypothetical protein
MIRTNEVRVACMIGSVPFPHESSSVCEGGVNLTVLAATVALFHFLPSSHLFLFLTRNFLSILIQ